MSPKCLSIHHLQVCVRPIKCPINWQLLVNVLDILEHMFTHIEEYLIIKLVDYCNFEQSDRHFRLTVIPGWNWLRKARIYQCIFKWLVSWMPPPERSSVSVVAKFKMISIFCSKGQSVFLLHNWHQMKWPVSAVD